MLRKIPCDWFLTDGILSDVRLGAPLRVMDALVRAGVVKDDGTLISRLNREWVFRRRWRYYAGFDAPKTEGARRFLVLEGLCGTYQVSLNGQRLFDGSSDSVKVAAAGLKEKENLIEIEFEPENNEVMIPSSGFAGAMLLYDCGSTAIMKTDARFTSDMCTVLTEIDAGQGGEVQLIYTLETASGTREKTVYNMLSKGKNEIEYSPFTHIGSGRVMMEISVKKDGITSDAARVIKYVPSDAGTARGFLASDGFGMSVASKAGANSVAVRGGTRACTLAADRALAAFPSDCTVLKSADCAMQSMDILNELSGGNTDILEKEAVWRLSGISKAVYDKTVLPAGEGASLERRVNVSRYLQAVRLREKAQRARLMNESLFLSDVRDRGPAFTSPALFDRNERPRPAYFALSQAWRKEHAFVLQPPEGVVDGICAVPVYYVCDEGAERAIVNVCAYNRRGDALIKASYPVMSSSRDSVGRLLVEVENEEFIIVRTQLVRSARTVSTTDTVISMDGREFLEAEETQLLLREDGIENAGSTAAIGVCIPGESYFGVILPGERVKIGRGKPAAAEGLNILY